MEVAERQTALVRVTQNRALGHLDCTPEAWAAFLHCTSPINS